MTRAAPRPARQASLQVPRDALRAAAPLLREIGDLKRVRTADSPVSMAGRAFLRSWAALARGAGPGRIAALECAAAVAGARLAGVDGPVLRRCGLTASEAAAVLARSVGRHTGRLDAVTLGRLREALPRLAGAEHHDAPAPGFAVDLCAQPRAGATRPGHPRLMVEPPESHGDHCWAVAVYGGLLAEAFGADPIDAFLLGLAHHLHNAVLPDAGFAGEELLGEHLPGITARLTDRPLAALPGPLASRLTGLLALREEAVHPAARAFHAADVLDRVLQVHHHARAAAFTAEQALDDLDLVHPCAVSGFHRAVLAAVEAA
ncbi:HD domain-containing protein [Streptomyces sp. CNQ085]|uniref:HD domain-containing protein n=1 Tax=Streptomyces sp. CNQ085 TaxID=2886944 RepID=UPI001F505181|nr:HD domain-containing protein [Streptomyces sp. CNQ085]MCI0384335.1 HD domain-containing protein [Streptomyces sp. CNQ085]